MGFVTDTLDSFFADGLIRPYTEVVSMFCKKIVMPLTDAVVGADIYFKPDSQLDYDKAIIKAIEVVIPDTMSITPNVGYDVLPNADLPKVYLTIRKGEEVISTIPLSVLVRNNNTGKFSFVTPENFQWSDCSVTFTSLSGITTTTTALMFLVWYDKKMY